MRILLLIALFFTTQLALLGQSYSFQNYNVEDGVSHPFIYDMVQDEKGFMWIATGEGLCRFNGFRFKNYFVEDGLSENFISTLHKASNGDIWMGHKQGGCSIIRDGKIKAVNTSEYLSSMIRSINQDEQGNIWILSQHSGVIKIDSEENIHHFEKQFSQLLLFDLEVNSRGQMIVGTNEGLYLYLIDENDHEPVFKKIIDEIPMTKINTISAGQLPGQYYIGTEDEGMFKLQLRSNNRAVVKPIALELELYRYDIQSVLETDHNNLWIGTFGSGLFHLAPGPNNSDHELVSHFDETNGLGSNDINSVYLDREGNIWAGKFGGNHNAGGISSLSNNAFVFYDHPSGERAAFYSIHGRSENYWMGLKNGILYADSGNFRTPKLYQDIHGLPEDLYTSIFIDTDSNVWAGSNKNGIFLKTHKDTIFKPFELSKDRLSMTINDITGNKSSIWAATKNGIYEIRRDDKSITYFNKENGLEHNVIKSLYLDEEQNLWYCTASSYLSYLKQGKIVNIVISEDQRVHDQVNITKDQDGNIWLATNGSGLFIFDYESIKTINVQSHGLKSNFCYNVEVDNNNKVWVGHKGGLSCYNPANDQVQIIGQNDGMAFDFLPNASFVNDKGVIWMGTNQKLIRYNPEKDIRNSIPPIVNIEEILIEDEVYTEKQISLPYGNYRTKIKFLGLSFKKPEEVSYQYILEGHDREWQEVTKNGEAFYSRLDPGSYKFRVVAFNSDGIKSNIPAEISIRIEKPFWQKAWFIVLTAIASVLLLASIIKLRDRRQKQIRQYLKKNLDIRTHEVQVKSRELEQKNKDITSSIHYAKKIQDATLPDRTRLKSYFSESFIYYQPRDIISGDFYWFKKTGNKLIISVSDCTGHGVPGALLSMIGSTKMNDIVSHSKADGPAEILRKLDEELQLVLKQTSLSDSPQDGMDMAVCELDLDTNKIRICSAMSNVYIATPAEVIKIDSDRNSIGGNFRDQVKNFTMHERQMQPGETLYLASDGYQDQFGGEKGKKLKRSGFVELLRSISHQPGQHQHKSLSEHLIAWKGKHEQVDDILVVGLKF